MKTLPRDYRLQLDFVLRLVGLLHRSYLRPRFAECVQSFIRGIDIDSGATLNSVTPRYAEAHDCYYAPFFQMHPHILENYLINAIFRSRFPFGRDRVRTGCRPAMAREFTLLAMQFTLMKGLLIGVSGFHRERFSAIHVVHTIQSASKHFEHHTEFLADAHALLVGRKMDSPSALAILLRDSELDASRPELKAIHLPESLQADALLSV